jgi:hypothetical protein
LGAGGLVSEPVVEVLLTLTVLWFFPDVLRPVAEEGEEGGEVREREGRAGRFLDDRGDVVATTAAPSSLYFPGSSTAFPALPPSLTELERTGFFLAFLLKNPNFLCSLGDVTGETWGDDLGDPPRLLGSGLLSLPVERGRENVERERGSVCVCV